MISENKFSHMIGVARMCYKIAKGKYNCSETFARSMWAIGFNHDIGYEFLNDEDNVKLHPEIANEILHYAFAGTSDAIRYHGKVVSQDNLQLRILNEADLQVDATGQIVTVEERLEDIKMRYGADSTQYSQAHCLALELGLLEYSEDD